MNVVLLSGGVGGAKLARGFEALDTVNTTVVVNVGDDESIYGLAVSPDLDTVVYTIAGIQGPMGWGRAGDSTAVMSELAEFGLDTSFSIGDLDLALNVYRTQGLAAGRTLSEITNDVRRRFGIRSAILPATDDRLRTEVRLSEDGTWLDFQTYFVRRRHADPIDAVRFAGSESATAGPGVLEAIEAADLVVLGPSNPVLSIWPILSIASLESAVRTHRCVMAVSPLIRGRAIKGPAAEAMTGVGLSADVAGVVSAYRGLIGHLVVDTADEGATVDGTHIRVTDTMLPTVERSIALARQLVAWC